MDAENEDKLNQDKMNFFGAQYMDVSYLEPFVNVPAPDSSVNSQFFVKEWGVSAEGIFTQNEVINILFGNFPEPIGLDNGKTIEITEQNGVPGQGNDDPRSEFENHALVKYNNKYYDPSYGSPIRNSQNEWETEALSFFGSVVEFRDKNNNNKQWYLNWLGHLNDTTIQTNFFHYYR